MHSSWVMLLTLLVSLKEFSAAQDSALEEAWRDWKRTYERVYTDEEEASRRAIWEKNLQMVEKHNREADEGKHTYWMKMNQFSDWTIEEFKSILGSLPETVDPDNASQGVPQAPDIQPTPKPKKCHQRRYGTSRKDQLALTYRRKRGKHHSENLGKLCLISSNGTKKLLGRRCGCISRYRRRCQKCCKLAL
ncbi:cathepsin J-like [Ahaetulla prasina]|uniref:cathepsin J-like n=1 Tax=Ahaetulla prasina TaxID=499056 RepID=UPI0026482AC6|nr:cathepsin J-like [Ahaetulla prasina]XP_058019628.1 cathepsin J-like [Ahaetulla prasina]XP_058019629.1 cathepsin J-like [Ahaetulla prasina]XP_058019630.1 cathepsin J-like [Ahaetulla prasina]